jgi:sarcosine oxidase subunit gamma
MIDTTGSLVSLELSGPRARDVLASCCPLDLDVHVFPVGRCAQSMIAKAPALLHLVAADPTFRLHVRPSLAAYVVSWLTDAMLGA